MNNFLPAVLPFEIVGIMKRAEKRPVTKRCNRPENNKDNK